MIKLGDYNSAHGIISIFKSENKGSVIYEQNGHLQSEGDRNGTSLASYIHALFGLLSQVDARSVLTIGCAGGTLATMLARTGCSVTAVDIDAMSFALARKYFNLPPSVECHVRDGQEYLTSDWRTYSAIALDAFSGDHIPPHLVSQDFFRSVRSHLSTRGLFLVNVYVEDDADDFADRLAQRMAGVWPDVRILDTQGLQGRNAIVMAGEVAQLARPYVLVPPTTDANMIDAELAMMQFRDRPVA